MVNDKTIGTADGSLHKPLAADSRASAATPSYGALATQYVDETCVRISVELDPDQRLAHEFISEMIARVSAEVRDGK